MLGKSPCPGGHVLADIFAGNDPAVFVLVCLRTDTHSFSSSVYAHSYYWCLHRASWVSTDKRLGLVVTRDTEADTEDAGGRILPSAVVHWHSVNIKITTPGVPSNSYLLHGILFGVLLNACTYSLAGSILYLLFHRCFFIDVGPPTNCCVRCK